MSELLEAPQSIEYGLGFNNLRFRVSGLEFKISGLGLRGVKVFNVDP